MAKNSKANTKKYILITGLILGLVGILVWILFRSREEEFVSEDEWVYPKQRIAKGAIVSNGGSCAEIGMSIMKKYGNAVDSLIATMLCDGLITFHKMGLGGGFLAVMYIKSEGRVHVLNAREAAPRRVTQDMFVKNKILSKYGGLAVAVPGEIEGYWAMYKRFGGAAPWSELFQGTIKLCEEGVPINDQMATILGYFKKSILKLPYLKRMLLNENGEMPKSGDKILRKSLCRTLRLIAESGPSVIYNGTLTEDFISDIAAAGGIITKEDLLKYEARWEVPFSVSLSSGHRLHTGGAPSSGQVLAYVLKLLDDGTLLSGNVVPESGGGPQPPSPAQARTEALITEALKFGYGFRSMLGDPGYTNTSGTESSIFWDENLNLIRKKLKVNQTSNDFHYYGAEYEFEDHGTANIVVYAPNGDAISATSSINLFFGSGVVSESTGILLNNHMDDFSSPNFINSFGVSPSRNNFISPGKRPMSSMCPAIVLDSKSGEFQLAIGAAGGTKIISAVSLVTMGKLWYNLSLVDAVKKPRFHHQLLPMIWEYEKTISKEIVRNMEARGHKTGPLGVASISAIAKNGIYIEASSDHRRPGNMIDEEKRSIYEKCVSYLDEKFRQSYGVRQFEVRGLWFGSRGTIPKRTTDFFNSLGIESHCFRELAESILIDSLARINHHIYS